MVRYVLYVSVVWVFFPDCYDFFSFRLSPFSVSFLYIVRFTEIRFPGIGSYRYAKFKTLCLLIAAQADFFWWNEIWTCATKFYIMRSLCWGSILQIAPSQYAIENMCPDLAGLAWARENDDNERATGFRVQTKMWRYYDDKNLINAAVLAAVILYILLRTTRVV